MKCIATNLGTATLVLLLTSLVFANRADAQEEIGGPYEPDSATVLLLHFDGDVTNATEQTADAEGTGSYSFIQDPQMEGLGQQLRVDNDSRSDSTYFIVPDTSTLDLTGSWTIELWVNVFTYGDTNDDWRWQPRLMFKPGEEQFFYSNYFITMWGGPQHFRTGYYTESGDAWQEIESPDNSMSPGSWFHITFIRDTTKQVIVQMLHDVNRELVHFESQPYDAITGAPPLVNDNPLYIGAYPGGNAAYFLDGFLDEIRISNVVRNFPVPPVITDISQPPNQLSGESVEISANMTTIGEAEIQNATLHYSVDGETWQTTSMSAGAEETYTATVPGQEVGTVVSYYVSAETDTGLRATVPAGAEDEEAPVLYSYAVWEPETQTLDLSFEEGEGSPVDHSIYENEVIAYGEPEYVESDREGSDWALRFDGIDDHLEIEAPAPFVNGEEFVVDFWYNADTLMESQGRFIIKEGFPNEQDFTYQVWSSGGGDVTPASYVPGQQTGGSRTGGLTGFDSTYTAGLWYRVVHVMQSDTTYARLYDGDNALIQEVGGPIEGNVHQGTGPLRIGVYTPSLDDEGIPVGPVFKGVMDEIKVYNYVPSEYAIVTAAENDELPQSVVLRQNFPNPFNPTTTIRYVLPAAERVQIGVYDVLGRRVATLVDDVMPAGEHQVRFDGEKLASGTYFYRLTTESSTRSRKMLLIK